MRVTLKRYWGSDLDVVNNARVSFGKESEWKWVPDYESDLEVRTLSEADKSLVQFLARGCTSGDWENHLETFGTGLPRDVLEDFVNYLRKMPSHWEPFANGIGATLHLKIPIFVARQLIKHRVGFNWSEISRRYVTDEPEFYTPDVWRKAAENVKQGSSTDQVYEMIYRQPVDVEYEAYSFNSLEFYKQLLASGVCPEQARMVLPQSMYTEVIMSGTLYGWANVYNQRSDSHAQKEIRDVAEQIGNIIEPLFPESWKELTR